MRSVVLVLLALVAAAPSASAVPAVTFGNTSVQVEGISPGGAVVWFSLARQMHGWRTAQIQRAKMLWDEDSDGAVTFELDEAVPPVSVWAAVDLTTGAYTVAVPEGTARRERSLPTDSLRRSEPGVIDQIAVAGGMVDLLVVRPMEGAWVLSAVNGGVSDADGVSDEDIELGFAAMRPLGISEASPTTLAAGDIVIAINPRSLAFFATQIDDAMALGE